MIGKYVAVFYNIICEITVHAIFFEIFVLLIEIFMWYHRLKMSPVLACFLRLLRRFA